MPVPIPMLRLAFVLMAALTMAPAIAQTSPLAPERQRFAVVSLHDVADRADQLDENGVSSERLVAFFEWLAGNGWTAISLDDVESARRGQTPLPKRAILITVDDGYRSLYTRVFPLALAYRTPIVAALVGEWLDTPDNGTVTYGQIQVPRSHFITWDQAREMQASGLVEFASHSYALHDVVLGNPQGNLLPAATTRSYSPGQGYETESAFLARLRADLQRSRGQLQRELGRSPRAMVWPYGRYGRAALEAARELGFRFALTLDPEPADASRPMALGRYLPTNNPDLGELVTNLRFLDPWPSARRIVEVDPSVFASTDPAITDQRLGRAIERLLVLGATHVLIDAATPSSSGGIDSVWFPNGQLPVRQDLLSRLAAQMRARGGVEVLVRLSHQRALQALGDPERVVQLFRELAAAAPINGLMLEDVPAMATPDAHAADAPWDVRARRRRFDATGWSAADALALGAFRAAEAERPGMELIWLAPSVHPIDRPSSIAEVTLVPRPLDDIHAQPVQGSGFGSASARRVGLWWTGVAPLRGRDLATATRTFQLRGGTIVGWSQDDPLLDRPESHIVAPQVSATRFPPRAAFP